MTPSIHFMLLLVPWLQADNMKRAELSPYVPLSGSRVGRGRARVCTWSPLNVRHPTAPGCVCTEPVSLRSGDQAFRRRRVHYNTGITCSRYTGPHPAVLAMIHESRHACCESCCYYGVEFPVRSPGWAATAAFADT